MWPVEFPVVRIIQRMPQEDAPAARQEPPYQYLQLGWETVWVLPRQVGSVSLYICWWPLWSLQLYANYYQKYQNQDLHAHTHIYIVHIYCHQTSVFFILIATIGHAIGHFASPCVTLCCSGQGTNPLVQIPFLNCRLVISNSFFLLLKSLFSWPDTVKSTSLCVCRIPLKLTDIGHKSVKRSFSLARIPVLFVFHASNLRFLVHPRHPPWFRPGA